MHCSSCEINIRNRICKHWFRDLERVGYKGDSKVSLGKTEKMIVLISKIKMRLILIILIHLQLEIFSQT